MHPLKPVVLAICLALPAGARADTVYSSFASFSAATTGLTTVTFDGIAPSGGFTNEGTNFSLGGVTFVSSSFLNVNSPNYYGSPVYTDGGYLLPTDGNPLTLTISFAPSTAIALNTGGLFGPTTAGITLSDGFTTALIAPDSITGTDSLDFIGFTSSTPITSLTLTMPGSPNYSAFDNISFGAAVTPEPSSLVLLCTGLIGVAGMARRKFNRRGSGI